MSDYYPSDDSGSFLSLLAMPFVPGTIGVFVGSGMLEVGGRTGRAYARNGFSCFEQLLGFAFRSEAHEETNFGRGSRP